MFNNTPRELQGIGAQCYNLFDCSGSLNCCLAIGPSNENFCYPVCDRAQGASCHDGARCKSGNYCCQGTCQSAKTYTPQCTLINANPYTKPEP
jgi:hypothetical protein